MDNWQKELGRTQNRPGNQRGGRTGGGRGGQYTQREQLSPECLFDTFYNEAGNLKEEIFYKNPKSLAILFSREGYKSSAFRQLFNSYQKIIIKLKGGRFDFDKAREQFDIFFAEKVVRQNKRKGDRNKPLLPQIVFDFIDKHRELARKNEREMVGLFQYIKNIYCNFEGN